MRTEFVTEPGVTYLTEGGQETEVMYACGFDLPEFSLYPLLDDPEAVSAMAGLYDRYLAVAARHGLGALMGGLDYRASPGWAARLGLSPAQLADAQARCIDFLRDAAAPYETDLPDIRIAGCVGPRGDAYEADDTITADEAEEYHGAQIATLAACGVDLVEAMTFNNVPEAVGVARAAAAEGLPASISFTLDSSSRLSTGPTLADAVAEVDAEAGEDRPSFYGINCSHPFEFGPAIDGGDWFDRVRILRPNAALADKASLCTLGHLEAGDPVQLGELMGELAGQHPHVDIWGGCCGTWDTHLDQIAAQVGDVRRRERTLSP